MGRTDGSNPSSEPKWVESIHRYPNGPAHLYSSLARAELRHNGTELREPLRETWKL
ncbi:hypothetical protein CsSME_00003319 [Camellia sinensis var. sinensis]